MHMTPPEEAFRAAQIPGAKAWLPAYVGKFRPARHAWSEPFERATALSAGQTEIRLATPLIGEPLRLGDSAQVFAAWWQAPLGIALRSARR